MPLETGQVLMTWTRRTMNIMSKRTQAVCKIAATLEKKDATTVDELIHAINKSFPNVKTWDCDAMLDIKTFLGNASNDLEQHGCPHGFTFTNGHDEMTRCAWWSSSLSDSKPDLVDPKLERFEIDKFQKGLEAFWQTEALLKAWSENRPTPPPQLTQGERTRIDNLYKSYNKSKKTSEPADPAEQWSQQNEAFGRLERIWTDASRPLFERARARHQWVRLHVLFARIDQQPAVKAVHVSNIRGEQFIVRAKVAEPRTPDLSGRGQVVAHDGPGGGYVPYTLFPTQVRLRREEGQARTMGSYPGRCRDGGQIAKTRVVTLQKEGTLEGSGASRVNKIENDLGATAGEEADGRDDKNVVAAQNNLTVYYDQASGQVRLEGAPSTSRAPVPPTTAGGGRRTNTSEAEMGP
ncbi:Hypp6593 [Branchiostoma lanceolatum]|uniref:Hypp6593 protein n=1 Tax=Branchiostoma lanceolatum TaxID=7740 RepID=A0A8K0E4X7_BRALA|nr:Hypp6593 [Branchiostoma lanceolatum]